MDIQSRLLLIDDEADFRQVIASSLLKHGFEVLASVGSHY
jgi:CheY-like chemotaxis protein